MKINDVILEKAAPVSAKVQGATGAKIAQTSGGQFMNKADRTNQAKVDAALGPGFKAGSKEANLALAKKFGQPAAAPVDTLPATDQNQTSNYTGAVQKSADPAAGTVAQGKAQVGQGVADAQAASNTGDSEFNAVMKNAGLDATANDTRGAAAMASKSNTAEPAAAEPAAAEPALTGIDAQKQSAISANPAGAPTAAPPAAEPAAASTTTTIGGQEVNPDTDLAIAPKPVLSGTGAKTNVTTGSDDEMAWRAKNPNWSMTGAQYPGAGQWDPRTGRSKKLQAQADANATAVKGFLNKINPFAKKSAAPVPDQGAVTQAVPPQPDIEVKPLNQSVDNNSEISRIKKLSGL